MELVWYYDGQNHGTDFDNVVRYQLAVADRARNLANRDTSPLPLTAEQVDAQLGAADPALRATWANPSLEYQSAARIRFGWSPADIVGRINEANGQGRPGVYFPNG